MAESWAGNAPGVTAVASSWRIGGAGPLEKPGGQDDFQDHSHSVRRPRLPRGRPVERHGERGRHHTAGPEGRRAPFDRAGGAVPGDERLHAARPEGRRPALAGNGSGVREPRGPAGGELLYAAGAEGAGAALAGAGTLLRQAAGSPRDHQLRLGRGGYRCDERLRRAALCSRADRRHSSHQAGEARRLELAGTHRRNVGRPFGRPTSFQASRPRMTPKSAWRYVACAKAFGLVASLRSTRPMNGQSAMCSARASVTASRRSSASTRWRTTSNATPNIAPFSACTTKPTDRRPRPRNSTSE